jgi:hypothetical protein
MRINKPEIEPLESVQLFFYSIWSMIYYVATFAAKNWHKWIHLAWMLGFGIVYHVSMASLWMWIAFVPGVLYAIVWAIWLRKLLDAS